MKRYYAKTADGMVEWFETKAERDAFCAEEVLYTPCSSTEARREMLAQIWETDNGSDRLRGEKSGWERHAEMGDVIALYEECCKYW